MEKIKLDKSALKKYGIIMGVAFLLIAALLFLRHRHNPLLFVLLAALFFTAGLLYPRVLKPIYNIWMRMAFVLGWLNTRLILLVLFYIVFMPVGLFLKLFRIDPLDRKFEKEKPSYWKKREDEAYANGSYERQF